MEPVLANGRTANWGAQAKAKARRGAGSVADLSFGLGRNARWMVVIKPGTSMYKAGDDNRENAYGRADQAPDRECHWSGRAQPRRRACDGARCKAVAPEVPRRWLHPKQPEMASAVLPQGHPLRS